MTYVMSYIMIWVGIGIHQCSFTTSVERDMDCEICDLRLGGSERLYFNGIKIFRWFFTKDGLFVNQVKGGGGMLHIGYFTGRESIGVER